MNIASGDLMSRSNPSFADVGHGVTLCYETLGDPTDPTLLLISGLGGQLIEWRTDFCERFVAQGFHVVRFDNRDAGLSTFLPEPVDASAVVGAVFVGEDPEVPYLLSDMAADAVGLLDHLGIDQAHAVGVSLGGMIAQTMAIEHEHRVASLTSIMSRTGDMDAGLPTDEAFAALLGPPPSTREEAIETSIKHWRIWGGSLSDETDVRTLAAAKWDRQRRSDGAERQLVALLASGSRTDHLRAVSVPTLVIHGVEDALIQPDGGERTAEAIPDAKLLLVDGMGHDLPRALWHQLVEAIANHARGD